MKTCTKCKAEKSAQEFYKDSRNKDGLQPSCKACAAEYYSANRERIEEYYVENRDRIAKRVAKYQAANPDKRAEHRQNRRERKLNAEGRHALADVRRIFEHQRGLCANCGAKLFKSGRQKFHVDHIMPLALGGSNWPDNLQCLCPSCNTRKHAKDPIEWAQNNGRLI